MERARWFVPGRIELIGKHVDYLGGRSLTCATPWGLDITATRHPSSSGLPGLDDVYSRAVMQRLTRDFGALPAGVDIRVSSTLPQAAGLSSSSAWVLGLLAALVWANRLQEREIWVAAGLDEPLAFASYAAAIEGGSAWGPFAGDAGVGTQGGAQDHLAIVCAEAGSGQQMGYLPARLEARAAWPAGWALLVMHSGVVAEKTGAALAAFNRVAAQGHAGGAARQAQFRRECEELVPAALAAIRDADARALGAAAAASQDGAEQVLGNQIPETITLVKLARDCGAFAASSFGAGFGGAVWAAAPAADASAVLHQWRSAYVQRFPERAAQVWAGVMEPAAGMCAQNPNTSRNNAPVSSGITL